jgi:hypothetical protein
VGPLACGILFQVVCFLAITRLDIVHMRQLQQGRR